MSRRTERVARLIQQTLGQIILEGMSDPRIDPAMTSITRVEVADDFARAKVYVSTMGSEAEQRKALWALRHAAGRLQERMMEQIRLRLTPVLAFEMDVQFKKSLNTLALIQQAMEELRQREQSPSPDEGETPAGAEPGDEAGEADADEEPPSGEG